MNYMNIPVKFHEFRYYRCFVLLLVYSLSSLFSYFSKIEKFVDMVYNQFRNYFNNAIGSRSIIKEINHTLHIVSLTNQSAFSTNKMYLSKAFPHKRLCYAYLLQRKTEDRGLRPEV